MVDQCSGGGSSSAAAEAARRAAEEAARKAAEEAAAEEAARQAAAQARARQMQDGALIQSATGIYQGSYQATGATTATGNTYSVADASQMAQNCEPLWGEGPPPEVPLPVNPSDGAQSIVDDWIRESKSEIGMYSTAVYDGYVSNNRLGLEQMGRILSPETAPTVQELIDAGDTEGYVNQLVHPVLEELAAAHPDASFELLTVDFGSQGTSMPGPHQIYTRQTVIRMTENGQTQDFVLDANALFRPTDNDRVHDALVVSETLDDWNGAMAENDMALGTGQATWDRLSNANRDGADYNIARGIMTMSPEAQAAFLREYGQSSDMPLGVLRPVDTVPADQILLTVDADPIAQGVEDPTFTSVFHTDAIDGLADSVALPPVGGLDTQAWRATLEQLAADPPASMSELRYDLEQLSGGAITSEVLDELTANDANALPAILNLVQDHPPEVTFEQDLNLSIRPGGRGVPATFESISYDAEAGVVVVETSLNRFIRDPAEQQRLADTYGITDVPMTIRVPLPDGADIDWSNPTTEDLALLNGQIQDIDSTSVFMHGYQSNREVWQDDMQRWMDLSPEPTIGIAFAGMGSEGDFQGSGDWPLTPKQYGYHMMETFDALGLYGRELNLYGHSMGGAALLQQGLATDRMVDSGANRPDVNYVLLQPAPTGDSVPFLTEGLVSTLISVQNGLGSSGWLGNALSQVGNFFAGPSVLNHLTHGAPEYIQDVHEGFAGDNGFDQLKATAAGLVLQAEPDPAEVQAFMENNHVLVVTGTQDAIVSSVAVDGLFDGRVFEVPGNHYAHLPSSIPEENHAADIENRVSEFLAEEPQASTAPPALAGQRLSP